MFSLVRRRAVLDRGVAGVVLALAACSTAPRTAPSLVPEPVVPPPTDSASAKLASRTSPRPAGAARAARGPAVDSVALERGVTLRLAHRPLALAIARRTRRPAVADRAAAALVREATTLRMSPSLLAAVLLIENRSLDTNAVSGQGAIGLMQVMPMHAGSYGCPSVDLRDVDANICHGARLLHLYLVRSRSMQVALRRYNGCVRGTNTPRCHGYPTRVLRTASRLRRDVLVSARDMSPMPAPSRARPIRQYADATSVRD
jgi:soluble lytic murein transglycosylase-like protein